jgi:hypothetical protein
VNNKKIAATLGLLAIVIVIGAGITLGARKSKDGSAASASTATTSTPSTSTTSRTGTSGSGASTTFKNGTYSATGSYRAPDGTQQIGITLTIAGDAVTSASAKNEAQGRQSSQYEDEFISDFTSQVVGMKVDSISIFTRATLTVAGFDNALQNIESQARA